MANDKVTDKKNDRKFDRKFDSGKYDFIGKARYLLPIWGVIMILGIFAIIFKGMNYGIDFAGGTEIQVQFQKSLSTDSLREIVSDLGYHDATVQSLGDKNEYLIRIQTLTSNDKIAASLKQTEMIRKITQAIKSNIPENTVEIRRVDAVGPQVGEELKHDSLLACFYSLFIILIYIGLRFDYKYAPAAVFCLLHDLIIIVAIFAVFGREVNVQTLAAILTLIGYSLNDTIINFDRVRENEKLFVGESFSLIVNRSINDMLSRSILTVSTTLIAVIALYFLSDGVIQQIAFTLGVGIILGTFSSIYIASPLVILADRYEKSRGRTGMRSAKA
ncbi:MAG: protein translocase subunit SecF [Bdellovibrionales bacterium]